MTKASPPPVTDFAQLLQAFERFTQNLIKLIPVVLDAVEKAAPGIPSLIDAVGRMPEVLQKAIIQLADEGWYLDGHGMSLQEPAELAEAYSEGRHQEVEDRLVAHYKRRMPEIEEELVTRFPNRAHIFRQAFNAHREGLYYLTVPTLLAQADGAFFEQLGEYFFIRRGEESFTKLKDLDPVSKALLAPFFNRTSIRLSSHERPDGFDGLNRHLVLHGESCDYGTEVRSLQAISFLYYVAVILASVVETDSRGNMEIVVS